MKQVALMLVAVVGWFALQPAKTHAQMEKRDGLLYDLEAFQKAKPALGEQAPDMELFSLKGQRVRLSDYQGKTVVLIKAGYT